MAHREDWRKGSTAVRGCGDGDLGLQGGPRVVFKRGEAVAAPTWGGGRAAAAAWTFLSPAAARDGEAVARAGRPGSAGLRPSRAREQFFLNNSAELKKSRK